MESDCSHKTCLACLGKSNKMHNHQEILLENLKILEILYKIVPLLMESHDLVLPEWICNKCLEHLLISYRFQKQCLQSIQNLGKLSYVNGLVENLLEETEQEFHKVKDEILSGDEYPRDYEVEKRPSLESPEEIISIKSEVQNKLFEENVMDSQKGKNQGMAVKDNKEGNSFEGREGTYKKRWIGHKIRESQIMSHYENEKQKEMSRGIKTEIEIDDNNGQQILHTQDDENLKEPLYDTTTSPPISELDESNDNPVDEESVMSQYLNEETNQMEIQFNDSNDQTPFFGHDDETLRNACNLCNQTFKTIRGLKMHHLRYHIKKHAYRCDICDKGFDVEEHYKHHYSRHLGIKSFKCNQCDKAFHAKNLLRQHLIGHSQDMPYSCTICGKSFKRSDGLRQHTKRHTAEKLYQCSLCPKTFKCHSDLNRHMKKHTNIKSFECDVCGARLSTSESLTNHKRIHTGDKPYKCKFCEKCFSCASGRNTHQKTHTGEKSYKCPYCPKTFVQAGGRNKHINVHKTERTFKCRYCDKSFKHDSSLRTHEMTHTGEKPYKCPHCPKAFRGGGDRNRHIKCMHTNELSNDKMASKEEIEQT